MRISNWNVYDIDGSIKASKYPMSTDISKETTEITDTVVKLAQSHKGEGHDNFLCGIRVSFDLKATNKFWVEAERYHFFDIVSSQSTMHRITKFDLDEAYNEYVDVFMIKRMKKLVEEYEAELDTAKKRNLYLRILYSNPCGFELTAHISTNYRQLKTIYSQRKDHRLPEWRAFCRWIETLPCSQFICG